MQRIPNDLDLCSPQFWTQVCGPALKERQEINAAILKLGMPVPLEVDCCVGGEDDQERTTHHKNIPFMLDQFIFEMQEAAYKQAIWEVSSRL